jgi:hypothetical protein
MPSPRVLATRALARDGGRLAVLVRQLLLLVQNRDLVAQLSDQERQLRYQAFHDPLTGLGNRALLQQSLVEALTPSSSATPTARAAPAPRPVLAGTPPLPAVRSASYPPNGPDPVSPWSASRIWSTRDSATVAS